MQNNTKKAYFAAANTQDGFVSYYADCFDRQDISQLYMIKGGPGTGKSRFLGDVASAALRRGWEVEYYYCSSDPGSLDGLVLTHAKKGKIALADTTPPHVMEPMLPGVRDVIVNLGDFWDREALAKQNKQIRVLDAYKQQGFSQAHGYLHTAGSLLRIRDSLVAPCVCSDRVLRTASRIASHFPKGDGKPWHIGLCDSIGMRGKVHFDTYERLADSVVVLLPFYGLEYAVMQKLCDAARERGSQCYRAPHVLQPCMTSALYFPENRLCVTTAEPARNTGAHVRRVDLRRLCNPDALRGVRGRARFAAKMAQSALDAACECFARAGEYHFELESLYTSAMDFDAKENFTATFCNAIL
ncbi:MAG: hypothetical protein E7581_00435 [Ruminococcaceae bacterium]|nr:hypothetical protein [Oscillospiraceae bacterium]